MSTNEKIVKLFLEKKYISKEQMSIALEVKKTTSLSLDDVLLGLNFVTYAEIAQIKSIVYEMEFVDLSFVRAQKDALKLVPKNEAIKRSILPLKVDGNKLIIVVDNIDDLSSLTYLERVTQKHIHFVIGEKNKILHQLQMDYYLLEMPLNERVSSLIEMFKKDRQTDVNELAELIIKSAITKRATDIHVTPESMVSNVFYRIDGVLKHSYAIPRELHPNLSVIFKNWCKMDISKKRVPQDGSFSYSFIDKQYDLRLSTLPTNLEENIVIRILEKGLSLLSMSSLGFSELNTKKLISYFNKPYGVILVTGPTGSGKTTTLYTALRNIDSLQKNVLTIEDPIEYKFSFIKQTQLNVASGYTFDAAIRSFMRQDPDVILVGEVRDSETAKLALRASVTGHLVLSTVHTNDAIATIARLEDLDVAPYLIATGVMAIINQRLIRKLCSYCKVKKVLSKNEILEFGVDETLLKKEHFEVYEPCGCEACSDTGFMGREAIIEILEVSHHIADLISNSASSVEILKSAKESGMLSLKDDGHLKVLDGITSFNEINRVVI